MIPVCCSFRTRVLLSKFLVLITCLSAPFIITSQSARVKNIDQRGDQLIITYDLDKGRYKLALFGQTEDGKVVKAINVSPRLDKIVKGGRNKKMNWRVLEDHDGIDLVSFSIMATKIEGVGGFKLPQWKVTDVGIELGSGLSFPTIRSRNPNLSYASRLFFDAGVFSNYELLKRSSFALGIKTGLYYSSNRRSESGQFEEITTTGVDSHDYEEVFALNFLRIPVLLTFNPQGNYTSFSFHAGFYTGFNVGSRSIFTENVNGELVVDRQQFSLTDSSRYPSTDKGKSIRTFDVGVQVALQYKTTDGKYTGGIKYVQGLRNLNNQSYWEADSHRSDQFIFPRSVSLYINIAIPFWKF